jgi:hypothetical protein
MFSEQWNADANDVLEKPVGLWSDLDNASDVSIKTTLDEQALGNLNRSGLLVPSYSVTLRPGVYGEDVFNMGDTVPLIVRAGRLDVSTSVRVVAMTFAISDDGDEAVELTVGRPRLQLVDLLTASPRDIDALARR